VVDGRAARLERLKGVHAVEGDRGTRDRRRRELITEHHGAARRAELKGENIIDALDGHAEGEQPLLRIGGQPDARPHYLHRHLPVPVPTLLAVARGAVAEELADEQLHDTPARDLLVSAEGDVEGRYLHLREIEERGGGVDVVDEVAHLKLQQPVGDVECGITVEARARVAPRGVELDGVVDEVGPEPLEVPLALKVEEVHPVPAEE